MDIASQLAEVKARIAKAAIGAGDVAGQGRLIAVSKTKPTEMIADALQAGHRLFGENRVQEAIEKWPLLKQQYDDIELHLIGPLQSNKAKDAVKLFDVIQTIDRPKIAKVIAREMQAQGRNLALFVQVNIGEEPQKAGVLPDELSDFLQFCQHEQKLTISGLMCIPPVEEAPAPYFALLRKFAKEFEIPHLSMGMSNDFETAVQLGADYVRVGSAIFGARD